MSSEEIIIGMPDTPYYQDQEAKELIDLALHQCAVLHQRVGTGQLLDENGKKIDDRGSKSAEFWVREQENRILGSVVELDPTFVEPLMYNEDSFDLD